MAIPKKTKFEADDVELLTSIIELMPNLTEVAYATKFVRKRLKYPIDSRDELISLFNGKKTIRLGERSLTTAQITQFLPEKFFPIESEHDLIRRLLITFQIGDIYHAEELAQEMKSDDTPVEFLPGPAYHPGKYLSFLPSRKEEK